MKNLLLFSVLAVSAGLAFANPIVYPYDTALGNSSFVTNDLFAVTNQSVSIPKGDGMASGDTLAQLNLSVNEFTAVDSEDFADLTNSLSTAQAMLTMVATEVDSAITYGWKGYTGGEWIDLTGATADPTKSWKVRIDFDYTLGATRKIRYLVAEGLDSSSFTELKPTGAADGWLVSGDSSSSSIADVSVQGLGSVSYSLVSSGARAAHAELTTVEQYGFSYSNLNVQVVASNAWGVQNATVTVKDIRGTTVYTASDVALSQDTATGNLVANVDLNGHVDAGKIYTYDVSVSGSYQEQALTPIVKQPTQITLASAKGWYGFAEGMFYNAETSGVEVVEQAFALTDPDVQGAVNPSNAAPSKVFTTVDAAVVVEGATPTSSIAASDLEGAQGALMLADTGDSTRSWACWNGSAWVMLTNANVDTANGTYVTKAEFDYTVANPLVRYSINGYVMKDANENTWFALPSGKTALAGTSFLGEGSIGVLAANYLTSEAQTVVEVDDDKKEITVDSNVNIDLSKNDLSGTYTLKSEDGKNFRVKWTDSNGKYAKMANGQLVVVSGTPANGMSSYASHVLNLDPESETAKPVAKTVQTSDGSKLTIQIPGLSPKATAETGVEVKYQLKSSSDPKTLSASGDQVAEPTFEVGLPTGDDKVLYYGVEIKLNEK